VLLISRLIKGDFEKASLSLPCCTPCQSTAVHQGLLDHLSQ
jgi:hypothetical protein